MGYKKVFFLIFFGVMFFSLFVPASEAENVQTGKITGIYSSLSYNEEGGDLLGEELFIVWTDNGYQATFQIAEGVPSELILVNLVVKGNEVSFTIPTGDYSGKFVGHFDKGTLVGTLKFNAGGVVKLRLPKVNKSYWQ